MCVSPGALAHHEYVVSTSNVTGHVAAAPTQDVQHNLGMYLFLLNVSFV